MSFIFLDISKSASLSNLGDVDRINNASSSILSSLACDVSRSQALRNSWDVCGNIHRLGISSGLLDCTYNAEYRVNVDSGGGSCGLQISPKYCLANNGHSQKEKPRNMIQFTCAKPPTKPTPAPGHLRPWHWVQRLALRHCPPPQPRCAQ